MRNFLYDRNKRINQPILKVRLFYTRVTNIQRSWRQLYAQYQELEEGLARAILDARNQLRDNIATGKVSPTKYDWLLEDVNRYCSGKQWTEMEPLKHVIKTTMAQKKTLRIVDMIRWMGTYSDGTKGRFD